MEHLEYFLLGLIGAGCFELLKLWEYRGKLTAREFNKLRRSSMFWLTVLGMLVASGFFAWAFNAESDEATIQSVVISGIASRSIIRELIAAKVSNSDVKLGPEDGVDIKKVF